MTWKVAGWLSAYVTVWAVYSAAATVVMSR